MLVGFPLFFVVLGAYAEVFLECRRKVGLGSKAGLIRNLGNTQVSFEDQFCGLFHFQISDVVVGSQTRKAFHFPIETGTAKAEFHGNDVDVDVRILDAFVDKLVQLFKETAVDFG